MAYAILTLTIDKTNVKKISQKYGHLSENAATKFKRPEKPVEN